MLKRLKISINYRLFINIFFKHEELGYIELIKSYISQFSVNIDPRFTTEFKSCLQLQMDLAGKILGQHNLLT